MTILLYEKAIQNKLKILWIAHRDPKNPKPGGAERSIYELCTRFVNKGHEVTLLSGGWKGCSSYDNINGIRVKRFRTAIGPHIALPVILIKNDYDIVINDLGHAIPWISSTLLKKNNIAFFHHLHSRSLPGQVNFFLAKFIIALEKIYFIIYHSAIFVTESNTSKKDLVSLNIVNNKIIKIPPGVDSGMFHPDHKTVYPSIIYFGGMRKYKRPEECLYMLKNILERRDDVKLYIVGSGPEEENVKKISKNLGIDKYVEFMGKISTESLAKLVSSCWVNIHTSITEGWGFSILEASSAGTPTIAYSVPGVVDAIEDHSNGILVKDGDRHALTKAALEIMDSPNQWWTNSASVAERYSWDITAELWEDLLTKTLNQKGKQINEN